MGVQKNRLIEMVLPQHMFWLRNKKNNFQLHAYLEPRRPDLMYNKHINNYFIKNLLSDK